MDEGDHCHHELCTSLCFVPCQMMHHATTKTRALSWWGWTRVSIEPMTPDRKWGEYIYKLRDWLRDSYTW
jgi:hypothetical protein